MKKKKKRKMSMIFVVLAVLILLAGFIYYTNYHYNNKTESKIINLPPATSTPKESPVTTIEPQKLDQYQVPILMYHYIRDFNDPNDEIGTKLSVSPEKFEQQLKWLKENGYQTFDFNYLDNPYVIHSTSSEQVSYKPIIITFDDGYKDAYTNAFPILQKHQMKATFYIITTYVDNNNDRYINWDEIYQLKDAGMNIGSHTITHPSLDKSYDDRLEKEVVESKKIIEEKIGVPISDFCYPSGKYDERTINKLKETGYKTAVTVHNGIADQNSNLFELPRIRMTNNTNLKSILNY